MSGDWTLDTFKVETSTESANEDSLYANGTMQVLVIVTVSAVNADNTPHALTDDELSSLKLIDCDGPLSDLPSGWSYSTTENIFDHVIGSSSSMVQPRPTDEPDARKQRYWVSTTRAEPKNIGASIKQDLCFEDLDLYQDTNTANGNIGSYTYDQDNYYLTIKSNNRHVRLLDCASYDGGSKDPYLYRSFGLFSNSMPCYIWYWWPVGPKSEVEVGCKDVHTQITINQQRDAGCFTRLLIDDGPNIWGEHYSTFTVYDQYGNSCVFYPDWVDTWNTLKLSKNRPKDATAN
ncbi:hypothetical protein V8C35DRAFT_282501 [Trichoderma chlorosporum]